MTDKGNRAGTTPAAKVSKRVAQGRRRRDNLIRLFPFEFWFDATVTVALRTVFFAVVLAIAAWTVRRWEGRRMTNDE